MPEGRGTSRRSLVTRIRCAVGNAYTNNGVLQTFGRNSENWIENPTVGPRNQRCGTSVGAAMTRGQGSFFNRAGTKLGVEDAVPALPRPGTPPQQ